MPALIEIVKAAEIRAYARGNLPKDKRDAVRNAIRSDAEANAIFESEMTNIENEEEEKMNKNEQVELNKREAKQGDNSWLSAKLLGASFLFMASFGVITFAAINLSM